MSLTLRACCAVSLFALVPAASLAAQAVQAPQKFAYVNTRDILAAAPGRAEAETQLQKEGAAMKATLDKMNDAYVQMVSDYTKLPPATPQAERDRKEKTVRDRQTELQAKNQEFNDQYAQRQEELLQPILDQIKLVLEDLRAEGNYAMILDVGQGASIVAADKNLNISDRVIAKLRTMPKPALALKSDSTKAKPAGAPLNAPAGVARPGTIPPVAPPPTKRPDSTATKKPAFE